MVVKAVEMVRKIRDKHYEDTKDLSVTEQIRFIKEKSKKLQEQLKRRKRSTADNTAQTAKAKIL